MTMGATLRTTSFTRSENAYRRSLGRLFGGVSCIALVGAVAVARPAMADDQPYIKVFQGDDGRNGKVYGGCPIFCSDVEPTRGKNGQGVTDAHSRNITITKPGLSAVTVGSAGGKGGKGDTGFRGSTYQDGQDGGGAGRVEFTETGTITGNADQKPVDGRPVSLLWIYSKGGDGGNGWGEAGRGVGGGAGYVSATIDRRASLTTTGNYFAGALIQSVAGNGGTGGGPGRAPGDAGRVDYAGHGSITTNGIGSTGVVVESIGGYGGMFNNGGTLFSIPKRVTNGGDAGMVEAFQHGSIVTNGSGSTGLLLQSVGGRGGDQAGSPFAGSEKGGRGGDAGTVYGYLVSTGRITTGGSYSFGAVAQSVGGSGGIGGTASFGGGSDGGAAAPGNTVEFINDGQITTTGLGSTGIVAQSVGGGDANSAFQVGPPSVGKTGGGGAGGQSSYFHIPFFQTAGDGGAGGVGGKVEVTARFGSAISTNGAAAHGILAQSVGGGGGTGGTGNGLGFIFSSATGGAGGGGGNGGEVVIGSGKAEPGAAGVISTQGAGSYGVMAQSVGGGGGVGGVARAVTVSPVLAVASAVGGTGGKGGNGGTVTYDARITVTTQGANATGVFAQSVGGGGGVGGNATAMAVALPDPVPTKPMGSLAISSAVGGSGGGGGNGGTVKVTNRGTVTTNGTNAVGIQAMSVGGGGGDGGSALAYAIAVARPGTSANTVTSSVGGTGGGGGTGGTVTVENRAAISTGGTSAVGIRAMSVGGGGGNAGDATAKGDTLSTYKGRGLAVAIGGGGKDRQAGGKAGAVTVTNSSTITTQGQFATGIAAQSIGGGGGNGAAADAAAEAGFSWDKTLSSWVNQLPLATVTAVNVSVGGYGGKGGDGDTVTVTNEKTIVTNGGDATGIFAQSIGGGGGNGGGYQAGTEAQGQLRVGGSGGGGGNGGTVKIGNASKARIETHGDGSHGMFVQSIGGGGGNGGTQTAEKSTPDFTGEVLKKVKDALGVSTYQKWMKDDANKSEVEQIEKMVKDLDKKGVFDDVKEKLKNSAWVKTYKQLQGDYAKWAKQQKDTAKDGPSRSVSVGIGGAGGDGGIGGTVEVTNDGTISTEGDVAAGIFAQSVGGGGGQAGAGTAAGAGDNKLNINLGATRDGGNGNRGGEVSVVNSGTVSTQGATSYGILAQSVGGGGGLGTGAIAEETKNKDDTITVRGEMGGNGGKGGHGDTVVVKNKGTVTTGGQQSHAIVAQSVGGGGGIFVMNPADVEETEQTKEEIRAYAGVKALMAALGIKETKEPADKTESAADGKDGGGDGDGKGDKKKPQAQSYELRWGGNAGAAGNGGAVTVEHAGTIATTGEAAFGIFAQSVGGGGGFAGDGGATKGYKWSASFGGEGGGGGRGGKVTTNLDGTIRTSGDASIGVFAQSVGGGGGYGGARQFNGKSVPFFDNASSGADGDGGDIVIDGATKGRTIAITTTGAAAHGIYAQSLGGGGGMISRLDGAFPVKTNGGKSRSANGKGGDIEISLKGSVSATGKNAYGIFAQSGVQKTDGTLDADRNGGRIKILLDGTKVVGGTGNGAAVRIDGGTRFGTNEIFLKEGAVLSAGSGTAIIASFGNESIENSGTIIGDVLLGDGRDERNTFLNEKGGVYQSGYGAAGTALEGRGIVDLGRIDNRFTNRGTFDIGGRERIATAEIKGTFISDGALLVDVDVGKRAQSDVLTADVIEIGGGTEIRTNVVDRLLPTTFKIMSAETFSTSGKPIRVGGGAGSPITWQAEVTKANGKATGVAITPAADFLGAAGGGLTDTEKATLKTLQSAWNDGTPDFARIFGDIAGITGRKDYKQAIDSLASEGLHSAAASQTMRSSRSLNAALSCPIFSDDTTLIEESQCVWGRVTAARMQQYRTASVDGFKQDSTGFRVGAQWEVAEDWFLGGTAGYAHSNLTANNGYTTSSGNVGDVSVALKRQMGPLLLAASVHAGYGQFDTTRLVDIGRSQWHAESTSDVWTSAIRGRVAYEFLMGDWYLRPYTDLDLVYTHVPGYSERGGGSASLRVSELNQWTFMVSPMLELGGRVDIDESSWLRPYASIGATLSANDKIGTQVSFRNAKGAGFSSSTELPNAYLNLGAGLQLFAKDKYELRGEYKAQIADDFLGQEASARFAVKF